MKSEFNRNFELEKGNYLKAKVITCGDNDRNK